MLHDHCYLADSDNVADNYFADDVIKCLRKQRARTGAEEGVKSKITKGTSAQCSLSAASARDNIARQLHARVTNNTKIGTFN